MAQRMSKRLQKEFEQIQKNSLEMKAILPNNDLTFWNLSFMGAKGTLYEGESFVLQLRFSNDYVQAILLSLLNLRRLFLWVMYRFTSIFIQTDLFVYLFCTIVSCLLSRMVAGPDCEFYLSFSVIYAE
jgi:hypothetical protein